MGLPRTSVLLTLVFLGVGNLLAAMVATARFIQSDEASIPLKPSPASMLSPCLLHDHVGGMVPLPSISSRGRVMASSNFNSSGVKVTYITKVYIKDRQGRLAGGHLNIKPVSPPRHPCCTGTWLDLDTDGEPGACVFPPPRGPGSGFGVAVARVGEPASTTTAIAS